MVRKFQVKKHEKTEAIRMQIIPYFSVLLWENRSLFQQEPCIAWIEVSPSGHFPQPPIFLASESAVILLCFQRPQQLKNLKKKKLLPFTASTTVRTFFFLLSKLRKFSSTAEILPYFLKYLVFLPS